MVVYLILDEQTSLLIFLFLIVLIAWKPETLPKIARELGRWYNWARKSMEDFMREINEPIYETRNTINETVTDVRRTINEAVDPDIIRIAKALNIDTQGKTRGELINEILRRLERYRESDDKY